METTKKEGNERLLSTLANKLLEAQQELDELALQFSLGKAEANDAFKEWKKAFRQKLVNVRSTLHQSELTQKLNALKNRFQELEDEMDEENEKPFEEQRQKLVEALGALRVELTNKLRNAPGVEEFLHELEKFELKLELIRLKFALKKFMVKEDFDEGLKAAKKRVEEVVNKSKAYWQEGKTTYHEAKAEIQNAYQHLRNALGKF